MKKKLSIDWLLGLSRVGVLAAGAALYAFIYETIYPTMLDPPQSHPIFATVFVSLFFFIAIAGSCLFTFFILWWLYQWLKEGFYHA